MANSDVLDILSDTLTPVSRPSANKDEIIREKVCEKTRHRCHLFFSSIRKKVRRKAFVDRKE